VWMMHAGVGTEGLPGTLSLKADAVVFRPKDRDRGMERFPLSRIRRARAPMAGSILELRMQRGTTPRVVGFYFVPPPSWKPREGDEAKGGFWGPASRATTRRKARKQAATRMITAGVEKQDDVKTWVGAVRRAKAER
jgi:hypothetical protein